LAIHRLTANRLLLANVTCKFPLALFRLQTGRQPAGAQTINDFVDFVLGHVRAKKKAFSCNVKLFGSVAQ